uniref:Uncharacterized protein n=1 Tax=Minutocellus polymorphus TaxID=265543 RepID=A0A7S0AYY2_9STRA|mmetsp:Transcript_6176/g.10312  ORF Transcript_6176/g.10312 Transcript_6176/m.10312 type:complete len:218 (+) Transcript_6176:385-1038(+)|eukprot:CAMPEP_0197731694 /NCGR_PEP_ID=MMETSP1434-20131217/38342_1 /TAXON_ID=265543 /ORGANISM="Minutocellus polymorphus, Strain CCMP3303" /LENGTH=217 /DNA_ID=CAMNT_0043318737 /DNA_START=366 /DNA_END=1019 /DNA_ORIENTATION=+
MVENKSNSVDDLISKAAQLIGVDVDTTRQCIGAILAFLKQQAQGRSFDFTKITGSIAGLDDLISEAEDDDSLPQIPKPKPGIPTSESEGATPADSPPVAPTSSGSSSTSSIFNLVVTIFRLFGIFAIIKQFLSLVPIVGQPAVRLIEGIEDGSISDGAELLQILKTKINKEQAIRLVKLVFDFMQENLDADTLSSLKKEVPAIKAIMSGSEGKTKAD